MIIFLCGNFISGWQDEVKNALEPFGHQCLDTRDCPNTCTSFLKRNNLEMIDRCDIIFAYYEASNPGGIDMLLEMGYGYNAGKKMIFVDELGSGYTELSRKYSEIVETDFKVGINTMIEFLEKEEFK